MNYRSFEDLNSDIQEWAGELPRDLDLIVGIPRSGLLAGNLLALYLNLPLTDIESLRSGTVLQSGNRCEKTPDLSGMEKILIVDDSVFTGTTIRETKARIDSMNLSQEVLYGAVYVSTEGTNDVDAFAQVVPIPRVFEWNMMHHPAMTNWAVDLDGVLCRDPTPAENDDGEAYREFITTVPPKIVPSKQIGAIVTCRLEKYRPETEAWLTNHGIAFGDLIMMDHPTMTARRNRGNHAEFKANVYQQSDSWLFIESEETQAEKIARLTKKPVLCTNGNYMLRQGYLTRTKTRARRSVKNISANPLDYGAAFYDDPARFIKTAYRTILQPA